MGTKRLFIFLMLTCCSLWSLAQQNYSISGIVRDQKETIPGVAIYLSGYKLATVTDNEGRFTLPNLKPGNYDVLVQMIGYLPVSKNVIITDRAAFIEVTLKENATQLKEVVVKPDPNREYYINLFKEYFIGTTPNSKNCKILNTQAINVNDDRSNRVLNFTADELLIIENQALGYRIKYLLNTFEYDYKTKILFYAGLPTFEELKGSQAKQRRWKKNREIAYRGSSQHFYQSLYKNTLAEEGFVLHKLTTIKNPSKLPDSLIQAKVRQFMTGRQGTKNILTFNGSDSLSYWLKQRSLSPTVDVLNRAPILTDTLVKKTDHVLKQMNYTDALFVVYKNEKESPAYDYSGFKVSRPPEIGNDQVTLIRNINPPIQFYPNGAVYDAKAALYSGFWSYEKIADLLPLDYIPLPKK
ncbi:MAG: carboxypeptidase-like regulatory domain-containing protein [Pedobacter sp.]|nr:carboxypeptidase-like regulatory domain-containing protein [Pedobacter sp.]MDQ8054282.1 carboxypeptidase-like regulatory domain-containing protein [Pedobacter sp.]